MIKSILTTILASLLIGCGELPKNETRWFNYGVVTSLRIDDDSEYHFSTDRKAEHDVNNGEVVIIRKDTIPTLYIRLERCSPDSWCIDDKLDKSPVYKFVIPKDYNITTFND